MPSAEPVEVTAMKSMMAIITEIAMPKRYVAKVALRPPDAAFRITPHGIKKDAKLMSLPVRAFTIAAPPSSGLEDTIMFVLSRRG